MKVLKKDKINRKIRNATKAKKNLEKTTPEMEYDELIATFSFVSFFLFLIGLLFFFFEDYNIILYIWICFNSFGILLNKTDHLKTKKRHYEAKKKNLSLIRELNIKDSKLSVEENYQEYFNELIQLKGSNELEKIKSELIESIIETYRKKDKINLPTLKNEDRIDQFIKIELSKSLIIENKNNNFFEILND